MSTEQNYASAGSGATVPPHSTQTVQQLFSQHPRLDNITLLPQCQTTYTYPEGTVALTIQTPADAIALFRALWQREEFTGTHQIYALFMRRDRVLGFRLIDMTSERLTHSLRIPQIVRTAYISLATHLILFSTHLEADVQEMSKVEEEGLLDLPETFENAFELGLVDFIRIGSNQQLSMQAVGWPEYTGYPEEADVAYNVDRPYRF